MNSSSAVNPSSAVKSRRRPTGMGAFTVIWSGQILSTAGTRMINFALAIWVWQNTGRASDLAFMTMLAFGGTALISPLAGSLVDRWNRRTSIIMSDLGAIATASVALILFATGTASFWSLLVVNTVSGAFLAFQYPAYSALVTSLLPAERYARANGMISLVRSVPAVFAPGLAGVLMALSGIWFVLLAALIGYAVAVLSVFVVALPDRPAPEPETAAQPEVAQPEAAAQSEVAQPSTFWSDTVFGFRYLASHRGFPGMLAIQFVIGMMSAMGFVLLTPLILLRTHNSEAELGAVNSIGALGGVLGAVLVSTIRPPAHKVPGVLLGIAAFSVFGRMLMAVGDGFAVWALAWFASWLAVPFVEAYSQTIWQQRIALAVQGRVFAAMQFLGQLSLLIGFAATGTLVEGVFEPAARHRSGIAAWFTPWVGSAPGSGMRLVFLLSGAIGLLAAGYGICSPAVRSLDTPQPLSSSEERNSHDEERAAVPRAG